MLQASLVDIFALAVSHAKHEHAWGKTLQVALNTVQICYRFRALGIVAVMRALDVCFCMQSYMLHRQTAALQ